MAPLGAPENFYTFYYSLASFSFILRAIWTSKMIKFKGVSIDSDLQNPKIFRLRRAKRNMRGDSRIWVDIMFTNENLPKIP